MTKTMTVTDAKARLSELVAAVANTQDHVEITRNGQPAAVLVSHQELATLKETVALLSDSDVMRDIAEANAQIAAGSTIPLEQLSEVMQARHSREE